MRTSRPSPLELLAEGVASLDPLLAGDGSLNDPVFDTPTQYGGAYYAWCCAVLAGQLEGGAGTAYRSRAERALSAALEHTADPARPPHASGFDRTTLSVAGRLNHRDFTWPAILRTYSELGRLGGAPDLADRIRGVAVPEAFRSRPPSNWAAVWLSGEWLRVRAGLSPTTVEQLDTWIDAFFAGEEVGFDLMLGRYRERGLPHAYDLFTRLHVSELLVAGYDGRHREPLLGFLTTGLRRSLDLQLSDGSLASGYRSAGQTWVLGAQLALFTASVTLGLGSPEDREEALRAAWRAYGSLATWQRPGGVFSPVQNLLPPQLRVGYETYTADGHYSPLALGFLASAVAAGFGREEPPTDDELDHRHARALADPPPLPRAVAHRGRISIGVQAAADDSYDATGLVDLTFGSGWLLHSVSAARHLAGGPWLVPGLALRDEPGAAPVTAVCGLAHRLTEPLRPDGEAGLTFSSELPGGSYRWTGVITDTGVDVVEALPGRRAWLTLLMPYLRDLGGELTTDVTWLDQGVRITLGGEWVELRTDGRLERRSDLPYGYQSRRGLCGLVRLDLAEPGDSLVWSVRSGTGPPGSTSDR